MGGLDNKERVFFRIVTCSTKKKLKKVIDEG